MAALFLIYDSITNTVFYNQILEPLLQKSTVHPSEYFFIYSFEKDLQQGQAYLKSIQTSLPSNIVIILKQRLPFWGQWSLILAGNLLTTFLQENCIKKITARGVFAAKIAEIALQKITNAKAFDKAVRKDITPIILATTDLEVLVPGIASEEVLIYNKNNNFFSKTLRYIKVLLMSWLIVKLEAYVFGTLFCKDIHNLTTSFLAASPALQKYITHKFHTPTSKIQILPLPQLALVSSEEKLNARQQIRAQLNIDFFADLYVYSGSLKDWQSFDLIVETFSSILEKDHKSILLVLTKDLTKALNILKQSLPVNSYIAIDLDPANVMEYLLACDFGMIFREENIVNWTARPIKAIEYKQAQLIIMHNNTIEWVINNC